jgi:hypothetical protein
MILTPNSELADFERVLRELPEEKRKVIVLVGRHPNEGTINIAVRHHKEWERHGAVVIRIPAAWTPHKFWHDAFRNKLGMHDVTARAQTVSTDNEIADFLLERGITAPIIQFHGGADRRPAFLRKIMPIIGTARLYIGRKSRIAYHPKIKRLHLIFHLLGIKIRPNEVLAEFQYPDWGKKPENEKTRYVKETGWYGETIKAAAQLHSVYLRKPTPKRQDLDRFDEMFSGQFDELIRHLAATGLKK